MPTSTMPRRTGPLQFFVFIEHLHGHITQRLNTRNMFSYNSDTGLALRATNIILRRGQCVFNLGIEQYYFASGSLRIKRFKFVLE